MGDGWGLRVGGCSLYKEKPELTQTEEKTFLALIFTMSIAVILIIYFTSQKSKTEMSELIPDSVTNETEGLTGP